MSARTCSADALTKQWWICDNMYNTLLILQKLTIHVAAQLLFLIGCCLQYHTSLARCIPGCDDTLQQINYFEHMNISETLILNNVSVNLREAEGRTDRLGNFNKSQVCPWHYESDYNPSRLPQVMYTARCDADTWCDHTTGITYSCFPLDEYRIPVMIGSECDLFTNTEWTLSFVNVAVSCYPSRIQKDTTEYCEKLPN